MSNLISQLLISWKVEGIVLKNVQTEEVIENKKHDVKHIKTHNTRQAAQITREDTHS